MRFCAEQAFTSEGMGKPRVCKTTLIAQEDAALATIRRIITCRRQRPRIRGARSGFAP